MTNVLAEWVTNPTTHHKELQGLTTSVGPPTEVVKLDHGLVRYSLRIPPKKLIIITKISLQPLKLHFPAPLDYLSTLSPIILARLEQLIGVSQLSLTTTDNKTLTVLRSRYTKVGIISVDSTGLLPNKKKQYSVEHDIITDSDFEIVDGLYLNSNTALELSQKVVTEVLEAKLDQSPINLVSTSPIVWLLEAAQRLELWHNLAISNNVEAGLKEQIEDLIADGWVSICTIPLALNLLETLEGLAKQANLEIKRSPNKQVTCIYVKITKTYTKTWLLDNALRVLNSQEPIIVLDLYSWIPSLDTWIKYKYLVQKSYLEIPTVRTELEISPIQLQHVKSVQLLEVLPDYRIILPFTGTSDVSTFITRLSLNIKLMDTLYFQELKKPQLFHDYVAQIIRLNPETVTLLVTLGSSSYLVTNAPYNPEFNPTIPLFKFQDIENELNS